MKKFLTVLSAVLLMLCGTFAFTGCEDGNTVVVYTNAFFPPFEYYQGDQIAGVDVEIMDKVGEKLGKTMKIVNTEFDYIIDYVSSGKGKIGAAGITITDARKERVNFSVPYYTSVQYIIVKEDVEVELADGIASWTNLEGKRIGVQTNTTGDLFIDYELGDHPEDEYTGLLYEKNSELVQLSDALVAVEKLKAGQVDVVVIDKLPAEHIVGHQTGIKCYPLLNAEEEYAICVTKGEDEILNAINEVLNEMMADVDENGENAIQRAIKTHMGLTA